MNPTTNYLSIEEHQNGLFATMRDGVQIEHTCFESVAVENAALRATPACPLLYAGWAIAGRSEPCADWAIGWALYCDGFKPTQCENDGQRRGYGLAAEADADTCAAMVAHAPAHVYTHFSYR